MKLIAYLVASYIVSYVVHIPIHRGFNPIIPAAVPWAMSATVAIWCTMTHRGFGAAWITLAATCAFFVLGHVIPHG